MVIKKKKQSNFWNILGWIIFAILIVFALYLINLKFDIIPQKIVNETDDSTGTTITYSCTDSDDGLSYYMPGYTTDQDGTKSYDNCHDGQLTEYYCSNDRVTTREVTCPTGYECYETRSGDYCDPLIDTPETISEYCGDLGYNKHWDTYCEWNCNQAAINECGIDLYEYFWNDELEWCCYKCVDDGCENYQEIVTKGFAGSTDELLHNPVTILDFYQGSTYYYENTDFLTVTNGIDWSPNGLEPTFGSSYTIVYSTC